MATLTAGCGPTDPSSPGPRRFVPSGATGTMEPALGCTLAPDCGACASCRDACLCQGNSPAVCDQGCSGSGCSAAPDCGGCSSCMDACACQGGDPATCAASCGGSSAGGVGGSGGTGGQVGVMDDPNDDVSFDWEETPAGQFCRAGHYVGTFEGVWASSFTVVGVPIPVTGNVDMWLVESENGEFFEVTDGKISGVADFAFPYEVKLSGRLDCHEKKFENGILFDGFYLVPGLPPVPWAGTIDAAYDKAQGAFVQGQWKGTESANAVFGGNGTWKADWVP